MIAIDTSSLIAFLSGEDGDDVLAVEEALEHKHACLPPVVLSEILSDPQLATNVKALLKQLPFLETTGGYWERAGILRSQILAKGWKCRLADSLIAQSCLDHSVSLITRDRDFRHFVDIAGLKML